MSRQAGFFDVEDRLKRLSDLGDQLEAFAVAVDFEIFRPALDAALAYAVDLARARTKIGLANLVYNVKRLVFLERQASTLPA